MSLNYDKILKIILTENFVMDCFLGEDGTNKVRIDTMHKPDHEGLYYAKRKQIPFGLHHKFFESTEFYNYDRLIVLMRYMLDQKYTTADDSKRHWYIVNLEKLTNLFHSEGELHSQQNKRVLHHRACYSSGKGTFGRLFSNKNSLQYLPDEIKHFLCEDLYTSLEMPNRFCILADYAKSRGIEVDHLHAYIHNTETILRKKALFDLTSVSEAKKRMSLALDSKEYEGRCQGYFSREIAFDANKIRKNLMYEIMFLHKKLYRYKKLNRIRMEYYDPCEENDVDVIGVQLQSIYCNIVETELFGELSSFLLENINTMLDLNLGSLPFFSFLGYEATLSCVPCFEKVFITTDDSMSIGMLSTYVKSFNRELSASNPLLRFELSQKVDAYEFMDKDVLETLLKAHKENIANKS